LEDNLGQSGEIKGNAFNYIQNFILKTNIYLIYGAKRNGWRAVIVTLHMICNAIFFIYFNGNVCP
jgi:hypothetical protein